MTLLKRITVICLTILLMAAIGTAAVSAAQCEPAPEPAIFAVSERAVGACRQSAEPAVSQASETGALRLLPKEPAEASALQGLRPAAGAKVALSSWSRFWRRNKLLIFSIICFVVVPGIIVLSLVLARFLRKRQVGKQPKVLSVRLVTDADEDEPDDIASNSSDAAAESEQDIPAAAADGGDTERPFAHGRAFQENRYHNND